MLNDRDNDKYEGHEESEYHFSEDEINYELEAESPKTETAAGPETKTGFLNRLTRSRRMLISLGVFLVLVFIVYKMVAPTSTVPPTTIAAAPMPAAPMPAAAVSSNQPAAASVVPVAAVTPAAPAPAAPVSPVPAPAQAPSAQAAPVNTIQTSPAMQMAQQLAAAQAQSAAVVPPAQPIVQNPPAAAIPAVIPVQAPVPTTTTVTTTSADTTVSNLTAESERLIGQLQLQYTQQLNAFANQNKLMQDQIQSLSARVSTMENQLNQLVQILTKRTQPSSMVSPPPPPPPAVPVQQSIPVKIAYNVQAIIPGRAWLKSDSGETLTVAEGDVIKDVGRVTKIDPYDGIVEINTGTKAVSLSYGNGS